MANKSKKIRSAQQKKELNQKIAEIIWITLGGIVGVAGIVSLVLGTFISNMSDNFKSHPFYPLYQFQEKFFTWLKSWSNISLNSFVVLGIILISIACVYLLIVLYIYANKQDAKDKRSKAKKLRERNLKKFEEERIAAEEAAALRLAEEEKDLAEQTPQQEVSETKEVEAEKENEAAANEKEETK
ncbi:MAG: hypothetical protein ACI4U5_02920 [Bacilli bacterium]